MHICVCICTFKRPQRLLSLLRALGAQENAGEYSLSVVVVDNDAARSAEAYVREAAQRLPFELLYGVEPRQNIARARNAAVRASAGDFIAFIDDDEVPPSDWLLTALRACVALGADGVLAPVRPLFERTPPAWILKGGFCERLEHPTGYCLHWRETRTGNVLLRRRWVEGMAEPFDPAFGNGGEDVDFFRRLMHRGARLVWCNEAAVQELVPPERCRRSYFLKRALLRGQNERLLADGASVVRSLLAVPAYTFALPFCLLAGHHRFMNLSVRLCDHLGKLAGLIGLRPLGKKYLAPD